MTPPHLHRHLVIDLDRQPVAVFDFDGTLTRADTLVPFVRSSAGPRHFVAGMAAAGAAVAGRPNEAGRARAKRRLLKVALRGRPVKMLWACGERYAAELLASAMRPEVVERLQAHRDRGDRVVIVSASLEYYLEPLAAELGVEDVICCRLGLQPGQRCSGELLGPNPRGWAKVDLVRNLLGAHVPIDFAYGNDPVADGPMLAMATFSTLIGVDQLPLLSIARPARKEVSAPIQERHSRMGP